MNEKIKKYLTLAGNTINKLPFKKLSEKYSDNEGDYMIGMYVGLPITNRDSKY